MDELSNLKLAHLRQRRGCTIIRVCVCCSTLAKVFVNQSLLHKTEYKFKTKVHNKLKPKINVGIYMTGEKERQWDTVQIHNGVQILKTSIQLWCQI